MRLSSLQHLAFATVLLALPVGGCASSDDATDAPTSDDDLTGGKVAVQGDFASTLKVTMGTPYCWDGTERRPETCGEIDSVTWVLTRQADVE